ncbi:phage holin family protein [Bergeyella sp. RCAD1439]|uniref:phage holin family protein n=1 Tax=Bergeyella anatis TaxID=3113737 RepID=UPI002E173B45|nr:phage holin family protein [Bergeyella sp. RCAD1439]
MLNLTKDYLSKRLELLKLEATEKSAMGVGALAFLLILAFVLVFFVILLNIGLGLWIGSLLGNYGYGVLIVAGFYFLLTLLLLMLKRSVKSMVANLIVKALNG